MAPRPDTAGRNKAPTAETQRLRFPRRGPLLNSRPCSRSVLVYRQDASIVNKHNLVEHSHARLVVEIPCHVVENATSFWLARFIEPRCIGLFRANAVITFPIVRCIGIAAALT